MTTKELNKYKIDLTALAKDKGFESTFLHGKPYLHSNKEPLRWLFWLTELNQWLMVVHGLGVFIIPFNSHGYYMAQKTDSYFAFEPRIHIKYNSYDEALAFEIEYNLKLLPNKL